MNKTKFIIDNISFIAVILLDFALTLVFIVSNIIEVAFTIRISSAILYFAMSVAVTMWFFWLGLRVGAKHKNRNSIVLISVAVAGFMLYVGSLLIGRFKLFLPLHDVMWPYFAEMLAYRVPQLLYGLVFLVLGIFISGKEYKLSGSKGWVYCCICTVLYLACCIGAELVYNGHDEYHTWNALIYAVSVFPLVGVMLSVYNLAGKGYKIERCKGFADFLAYLCPSAIFIYVLKIYASPILVLLYLVVMWFIYRKFR